MTQLTYLKKYLYEDEIGYVQIIEAMGGQFTPAEDARMSTDAGSKGPELDAKLQKRLLTDAHTSPFEGLIIKIEMCIPIFVRAELDRHRTITKTGEQEQEEIKFTSDEHMRKWFARNEMSSRYIQMPAAYYHPEMIRDQSKTNKQGGSELTSINQEDADFFRNWGQTVTTEARKLYDWAISKGIEKGLARIYNTQNQYTKIRYTGSFKNWCDVLALRLQDNVLWECRQAALAIEDLLTTLFPVLMKEWRRSVYETIKLTREEIAKLITIIEDAAANIPASPEQKKLEDKLHKFLQGTRSI